MRPSGATELWWKHAVFYCLDVETFMDSDGDGVGDFPGLTERIDYLAGLGVTCVWLLPFYPSPNRDDGYDVSDFYGVDPRLGTVGDFVEFVRAARERGIRVLIDLPINHTSDRHPWFRRARASRDSPYHDYYVWADEKPDEPSEVVFPGEVDTTWTYDEGVGRWYFHRFHPFQPDLNIANPRVRRELEKMMGYWSALGVSAFRVDALPFLLEQVGPQAPRLADPHEYIRRVRSYVARRRADVMLLGEANVAPAEMRTYFGAGDEMHMLFDYPLTAAVYLALARCRGEPIARYLHTLPTIPEDCQWLNFLRIHDEVNLEPLEPGERDEVFARLAPDDRWRIYGRGLRRRLPPLLHGDRRRLVCAYSLLFSLPGTPCLLYGEEIGMGDDLDAPGRLAARPPMQWSADPSGGFSLAPPERLVRTLVLDPEYGPARVNVADQRRRDGSLLSWVKRLVSARRDCPELGWGAWSVFDAGSEALVAHEATWEGSRVAVVHNLSPAPATMRFPFDEPLVQLVADHDYQADRVDAGGDVEVGPFGFRWFRCERATLLRSAR